MPPHTPRNEPEGVKDIHKNQITATSGRSVEQVRLLRCLELNRQLGPIKNGNAPLGNYLPGLFPKIEGQF
jgi:hypothetical protein